MKSFTPEFRGEGQENNSNTKFKEQAKDASIHLFIPALCLQESFIHLALCQMHVRPWGSKATWELMTSKGDRQALGSAMW